MNNLYINFIHFIIRLAFIQLQNVMHCVDDQPYTMDNIVVLREKKIIFSQPECYTVIFHGRMKMREEKKFCDYTSIALSPYATSVNFVFSNLRL